MKKLLILLLLSLPLISKSQTVNVWNGINNETHYQIRVEQKAEYSSKGVFEFTVDNLNTNEMDYYVFGTWKQVENGIFVCKIKTGNNYSLFPKQFIVKRHQSYDNHGIELKYVGRFILE